MQDIVTNRGYLDPLSDNETKKAQVYTLEPNQEPKQIIQENKQYRNTIMKKNTIKLNESQLRKIIKESIKNVLNEITSTPGMGWMGLQFEEDDWIPVNEPTEGDVCMKIKLWPGQGYALDAFKAYTKPGDYEGALELLVAYLDKNGIDKYFTDTWVRDEIEELKEKGYSQDEIDSEIETWGDYYIDATGLGASKPHWLIGENLAIQQFPLN